MIDLKVIEDEVIHIRQRTLENKTAHKTDVYMLCDLAFDLIKEIELERDNVEGLRKALTDPL